MPKITLNNILVPSVGREFSIPAIVENYTDISAVSIEIIFNSSCMRLIEVERTSCRIDYNEYQPGKLRILWTGPPKTLSDGDGLFILKFVPLLESITGVEFTEEFCELANWDGIPVDSQFIGCEVSISS